MARNPTLSQHAKTFVYHIDALHNQPYQYQLHLLPHFRSGPNPHGSDLARKQKYSRLDELTADLGIAKEMIKDDGEGYRLQRLLMTLPNLKSIQLRCTNEAYGPTRTVGGHVGQMGKVKIQPVTGRLILVLFLLMKNPRTPVTSIVCERLDWDFFYRISSIGSTAYSPLDRLRHLQLGFTLLYDSAVVASLSCPEHFEQFFKATSNLEVLILDFGAYDNYDIADGAGALGNAILASRKWSRLKTLSLAGFIFGHDELLNFLDLHPTLRNLRLSQIFLYSGTVLSLILELRKNASLNHLSFHGVYDDRIFEDDLSEGGGSCIAPANVMRSLGQTDSLSISCSPDEEGPRCAGYRADEWFGGDGSWCTCDGTPADESTSPSC